MESNNATPEIVEPEKTIADYEKALGLGDKYTPEDVLKSFDVSYWVKKENEELDLIGPDVEAKLQLLRVLVSSQMKAQRYFEIISPFENSCVACRGTGEIYKFKRKTVKVNCHICAGKKQVRVKCPGCKGTGRYVKKWKGGGGINVTCKKCKGKKEVYADCVECRGKGKKKKIVPDHEIKSTTPCKHCQQLGFTDNVTPPKPKEKKKEKRHSHHTPSNPVIDQNLADKIKASMMK